MTADATPLVTERTQIQAQELAAKMAQDVAQALSRLREALNQAQDAYHTICRTSGAGSPAALAQQAILSDLTSLQQQIAHAGVYGNPQMLASLVASANQASAQPVASGVAISTPSIHAVEDTVAHAELSRQILQRAAVVRQLEKLVSLDESDDIVVTARKADFTQAKQQAAYIAANMPKDTPPEAVAVIAKDFAKQLEAPENKRILEMRRLGAPNAETVARESVLAEKAVTKVAALPATTSAEKALQQSAETNLALGGSLHPEAEEAAAGTLSKTMAPEAAKDKMDVANEKQTALMMKNMPGVINDLPAAVQDDVAALGKKGVIDAGVEIYKDPQRRRRASHCMADMDHGHSSARYSPQDIQDAGIWRAFMTSRSLAVAEGTATIMAQMTIHQAQEKAAAREGQTIGGNMLDSMAVYRELRNDKQYSDLGDRDLYNMIHDTLRTADKNHIDITKFSAFDEQQKNQFVNTKPHSALASMELGALAIVSGNTQDAELAAKLVGEGVTARLQGMGQKHATEIGASATHMLLKGADLAREAGADWKLATEASQKLLNMAVNDNIHAAAHEARQAFHAVASSISGNIAGTVTDVGKDIGSIAGKCGSGLIGSAEAKPMPRGPIPNEFDKQINALLSAANSVSGGAYAKVVDGQDHHIFNAGADKHAADKTIAIAEMKAILAKHGYTKTSDIDTDGDHHISGKELQVKLNAIVHKEHGKIVR